MTQIIEKWHDKIEINSNNPIDTNILYLWRKTIEWIKEFWWNWIKIVELYSCLDEKTLEEFENIIKKWLYLNKNIQTNIA